MLASNLSADKYIFQREIPGVTAKLRPISRTECSSVVRVLLDLFTTHLYLSIFPVSWPRWCSRERLVATRFANVSLCFLLTCQCREIKRNFRRTVIFVLRMSFSGSGALNNAFLSGRHTRPPRKANNVGLQTFVTLVCADPLHYITLERPCRLG